MRLWVLVGNSSYMRIFSVKGMGKEIEEIYFLDHPEGREKVSDLVSDRPGRTFASTGASRHAIGDGKDIHQHELQLFSHRVMRIVKKGKEEKQFDELAIVAPPNFLGELRMAMHDILHGCPVTEVHKDLPEYLEQPERIKQIRHYLNLWNE